MERTNTRVNQKFCNILITRSTIWQLQMILSRLWRGRTILDSQMPSSPYTLRVLLLRFASMTRSTAAESTVLVLLNIVWSSKLLQSKQNFFKHLVTRINCVFTFCITNIFVASATALWPSSNLVKHVTELDHVARSFVRLSNYRGSKAMPSVSVH